MSEDLAKQAHYEVLSPQPIEVIKAWDLDFFLGNVVKYIGRCKTKGQELEDLKKAKVYLQWKIDELQGKPEPPAEKPVGITAGLAASNPACSHSDIHARQGAGGDCVAYANERYNGAPRNFCGSCKLRYGVK